MNIDRYGLSAQYDFSVEPSTLSKMDLVVAKLNALVKISERSSKVIDSIGLEKKVASIGAESVTTSKKIDKGNKKLALSLKNVNKQLKPLKAEYRAIVSEARNINWGDLLQPRKFNEAKRQTKAYILELEKLESHVKGNTAAERTFVAQLKRKQTMMKNNIELQKQERLAAKAAYRIGEAQVLRSISKSVIVPFKRVAEDGIRTLAEFDDRISSVKAVSGASASEMKKLREEAKKLGASTRFSASQVAEAQAYLAMAGFNANQVLESQADALNLAAAGQLELSEAADIASNVLSSFNLEAAEMGRVTDVLAKTASTTNTNVSQLGEAFKFAAPNAKQFGATMEETAALIGIAGNVGIQGSLAGTGARSGFINLTQTKKQKALLDNFGVSAVESDGTARNIISIIGDIKDALDTDFRDPQFLKDLQSIEADIAAGGEGAEESLKQLSSRYPQYASGLAKLTDVFGKTAVSFWGAQISQYDQLQKQALVEFAAGVDDKELAKYLNIDPSKDLFVEVIKQAGSYEDALDVLQNGIKGLVKTGKGGEGAASAMARIMEQNLAGSFRSLGSAIEAFKIAYFEPLKPAIIAIVNTLAKLLRFMANLPAPVRTIVSGFGVMIVTATALTAAISALAVTLFTFSKAAGVAAIAQNNLATGAAIPLTGFFETSMKGMAATSPISTISKNYNIFLNDFKLAWRETLGTSLAGLKFWAARATVLIEGVCVVAKSMLFNPFTFWIAAILILNTLIEQVIPGFNLLGLALSTLVAPFAFIYGFTKGLVSAFLDVINLGRSQSLGAIATVFQSIGNAISQAATAFSLFSSNGEAIGRALGDFLMTPFVAANAAIVKLWNSTIEAITRRLQPFANFIRGIGQKIVSFLAENSPGPTFLIRQKWSMTIDYLSGLLGSFVNSIANVAHKIVGFLNTLPLERLQKILSILSLIAVINPGGTAIGTIAGSLVFAAQALTSVTLAYKHLFQGEHLEAARDLITAILVKSFSLASITKTTTGTVNALSRSIAVTQYVTYLLTAQLEKFILLFYDLDWIANHFELIARRISRLTGVAAIFGRTVFSIVKDVASVLVNLFSFIDARMRGDSFAAVEHWLKYLSSELRIVRHIFEGLYAIAPRLALRLEGVFTDAGIAILNLNSKILLISVHWSRTIEQIKSKVTGFANFIRGIGQKIVSFLAENSPGPTFLIRQKWSMTIDYLSGLFVRVISAATLVNNAFLGIGNTSEELRQSARADIFAGFIRGVRKAGDATASFVALIIEIPKAIDRSVASALENLDLFSFFALLGSSLPMTLMQQLRPAAAAVVPELGLILATGIPRAILYALPAAVAYAISTGAIQGAQAGISAWLDRLPQLFHRVTDKIRLYPKEMKVELEKAINDSINTISNAAGISTSFNFNFDNSLAAIDRFADSGLVKIIDYLHGIGETSKAVGKGIAEILRPMLSIKTLPFLPSTIVNLAVIIPLYKALIEVLGSPALKGSVGFLTYTLFPALMRSIQATAVSLSYFITMLFSAPMLLIGETIEQIFGIFGRASRAIKSFSFAVFVEESIANIVFRFKVLIYKTIPSLLRSIPGIGDAIARIFVNAAEILSRFFPKYFKLLVDFFPTDVFRTLFASYLEVFAQLGRGVAYAVAKGLAPISGILLRILDPAAAVKFIKLYFRTSGFRTIVKSGLFAINPLDLLFGSKWMQVAVAAMKVFAQMAFPKNIVSSKMSEALQMLADPMARANAVRRSRDSGIGLLVSRLEIYKKSAPPVRILIRLLEGLMIVNPLIQLIGSLGMALMFWYSILKPLNNEMIMAIGHLEVFNISLMPLAIALKGIRFLVVDVGEVLGNMLLGTPSAIRTTMMWFDRLGDAIGRVVRVASEVTRLVFNLSKNLVFDPLFAAIAYPLTIGLKLVLVEIRNLLIFVKNETEAYGDAIVALTHGNIMPLMRQLFYDLMLRPVRLIRHLLDLTIGNVLRGLAAISRAIFALGREIVMLITHPVAETQRLTSLLGAEFSKLEQKLSPYTERLAATTSFLMQHKALIMAIGVGIARILGVFSGYTLVVDLMGAIAFLVSEYRNGFAVLNALIKGITHPVEWLNHLIESIGAALQFSLPPEFSDVMALVTNSLISAFPIIIAGIFTVGLLMRKNIGGAFGFVLDSGMKFVGMIMSAIDAMRDLAFITKRGLNRTSIPIMAAQGIHNIRSQKEVSGFKNPLAYSRDPGMQQRAVDMGENLKLAKEIRRYEKAYIKQIKRREKRAMSEMIRQAKYGTAEEKLKLFANQNIDENGRVTARQPMLEEYTNKFGRKDYRATQYGKMELRDRVASKGGGAKDAMSLFKAYVKHGSAGLDDEKLAAINKDIYDRYRGRQTTSASAQLIAEVRSGMESLHSKDSLNSIQSKFIYADSITVKSNTSSDLNPQNFDSTLNNWKNSQHLGDDFRDQLTAIPNLNDFKSKLELAFKSGNGATQAVERLFDEVNDRINDLTFLPSDSGKGETKQSSASGNLRGTRNTDPKQLNSNNNPDGFELSSSLFKSGRYSIEQAIKSGDYKKIAQVKQEIVRYYVEKQSEAIKHAAKAQKVDLDSAEMLGFDPTIATSPLSILRSSINNLVDETVSQSQRAERGIIGSTKRLAGGFLKATGIKAWFEQIQYNLNKDTFARELERNAVTTEFYRSRKAQRQKTRRHRSVENLVAQEGETKYQNLMGDDRLNGILEHYIQTGEARYDRGARAFAESFRVFGGSFVDSNNGGVGFAKGKELLQKAMNQEQQQQFRKFIEHDVGTDRGIKQSELQNLAKVLYDNTDIEFAGVKSSKDLEKRLIDFRRNIKATKDADGIVDSNALKDFQAMMGSPKNTVKANQQELLEIANNLGFDDFHKIAKGVPSKNLITRIKHNFKDFFTATHDQLDGLDFRARSLAADAETYAGATKISQGVYARLKNFGKPIYEKLFNGIKRGVSGSEQKIVNAVETANQKIASLSTSGWAKSLQQEIINSNRNMFTAIKNYKGRSVTSVKEFTYGLGYHLSKNGIDKATDRAMIASAVIKSRAEGVSIQDVLKERGYGNKMHAISQAFADNVGISIDSAANILKNKELSPNMATPTQIIVAQKLPALFKAVGQDIARGLDLTLGRLSRGIGTELLVNLGPNVAADLGRWSKKVHDFMGKTLNKASNVVTDLGGDTKFAQYLRRMSQGFFDRGMASADKLFAISKQAGSGETTRLKKIFDAGKSIYDSIAERLKGVKTKIDAQGGLWEVVKKTWTSFKKMFTGNKEKALGERVHQGRQDVSRLRTERDLAFKAVTKGGDISQLQDATRNYGIAKARLAEDEKKLAGVGDRFRRFAARLRVASEDQIQSLRAQRDKAFKEGDISRLQKISKQLHSAKESRKNNAHYSYIDSTENLKQQGLSSRQIFAFGTDEQEQNLKGKVDRMAGYATARLPKFKEFLANMAEGATTTAQEIAVNFSSSARKSGDHWEYTKNKIAGTWTSLWGKAKEAGQKILHNISENSPGPSEEARNNWEHTEQAVASNMKGMEQAAATAGSHIEDKMAHSSAITESRFARMSKAVGGFWKTGLMVGTSLSAIGMASQTIGYSLSNMGIIEADSQIMHALTNLGEITTIFGSIGSVAAPLLSLGINLTGTLVTTMGAIVPLVTEIGAAIATFAGLSTVGMMPMILGISAIATGLVALYYAFRTNFLGIATIVRGVGSIFKTVFAVPIAWVTSAWENFADRFGGILYPIIEPAVNVAKGLIGALNCHPTEKIPEAWGGAVDRIKGMLSGLVGFAVDIGRGLIGAIGKVAGSIWHFVKPIAKAIAVIALGVGIVVLAVTHIGLIVGVFGAAAGAIGAFGSAFGAAFGMVITAAVSLVGFLWSGLWAAIPLILHSISLLFSGTIAVIGTAIHAAFTALAVGIPALLNGLWAAVTWLFGVLIAAPGAIVTAVTTAFTFIAGLFGTAGSAVVSGTVTTVSPIASLLSSIGYLLLDIPVVLGVVVNSILGLLGGAIGAVIAPIASLLLSLKYLLLDIPVVLGVVVNSISGLFGGAIGAVIAPIVSLLSSIGYLLLDIPVVLGVVVNSILGLLGGAIGAVIAPIVSLLSSIGYLLLDIPVVLGVVVNSILGLLGGAIGAAIGAVISLFGEMIIGIASALGSISGLFTAHIPAMFVWFKLAPETATEAIEAIKSSIRAGFSYILNLGRGFIASLLNTLVYNPLRRIESAWSNTINKIKDFFIGLKDAAQDLGGKLIGALNCHPTIRVTEAWAGAVENIKGFLDGLLGFGIGIGEKLAGVFSGITGLFKHHSAEEQKRAAAATPVASASGGESRGVLGLGSVITAPIKILFLTVYNAIDAFAGKVANFIEPLAKKIEVIAKFFESLATIVESIAYIEKVIGPLIAKNKVIFQSIVALANTLNSIAVIFDSLDYITTFIFKHDRLKNRTAYTPHAVRSATEGESDDTDDKKSSSSDRVSGISQLISFGQSIGSIVSSTRVVKENWDTTTEAVKGNLNSLSQTAKTEGYEIQKAISEGSPGTTERIREHWNYTADEVGGQIEGLDKQARVTGESFERHLNTQQLGSTQVNPQATSFDNFDSFNNFQNTPGSRFSLAKLQAQLPSALGIDDSTMKLLGQKATSPDLAAGARTMGMGTLKLAQDADPETVKQALLASELTGIGKVPAKLSAYAAIESGKISVAEYQDIQNKAAQLDSPTQKLAREFINLQIEMLKLRTTIMAINAAASLYKTIKPAEAAAPVASAAASSRAVRTSIGTRHVSLSQRMGSTKPSHAREKTLAQHGSKMLTEVRNGFKKVNTSLAGMVVSLRTMAISQWASISAFASANPLAMVGIVIGLVTLLVELLTPRIEIIGHVLGVLVAPISFLYGAIGQLLARLGLLDFEKFNRQLIAFTRNLAASLDPKEFFRQTGAIIATYFIGAQNAARVLVNRFFDHFLGKGKDLPEVLGNLWSGFMERTEGARTAISDLGGSIKTKLTNAWSGFTSIIGDSISALKEFLSNYSGVVDKVVDGVNFVRSKLPWLKPDSQQTATTTTTTTAAAITIDDGATAAKENWDTTTEAIASNISGLVESAPQQGYELQKAISEGSPGPTYWIRKHWAYTTDELGKNMSELSATALLDGDRVRQALDIRSQMRGNATEIRRSFDYLGQGIVEFGEEATRALLKLDLSGLGDAAGRFGKVFNLSLRGAIAGVKSLTWNTILFGITSVATLSPVLAAFGVFIITAGLVAFGLAVIVANFLGLRSILKGLYKIIRGLGQIAWGVIQGVVISLDGLRVIAIGLFKLLRGDITVLWQGVDRLKQGWERATDSIKAGLSSIAAGVKQVISGVLTGLAQIFGVEIARVKQELNNLWSVLSNGLFAGDALAAGLVAVFKKIGGAFSKLGGRLGVWAKNAAQNLVDSVSQIASKLFSREDTASNNIVENLKWIFSKQGLAALGFSNPFAGIAELFKRGIEMLPAVVRAPLNYLFDFMVGFTSRLKQELPPELVAAFDLDRVKAKYAEFVTWLEPKVEKIKTIFGSVLTCVQNNWQRLSNWLVTTDLIPDSLNRLSNLARSVAEGIEKLREKVRFLSLEATLDERPKFIINIARGVELVIAAISKLANLFVRVTEGMEMNWYTFTELLGDTSWVKAGWSQFLNWLPRNLEDASFAASELVEKFQLKFKQFVEWFTNTDLIPKGIAKLSGLLSSVAEGASKLSDKIAILRLEMELDGKKNFVYALLTAIELASKGIKLFSRLTSKVLNFLLFKWDDIVTRIAVTGVFEAAFNTIKNAILEIPTALDKLKQWWSNSPDWVKDATDKIKGAWSGFTNWFKGETSWSQKAGQAWDGITEAAVNATDKIKGAWSGFSDRFKVILNPIVNFAEKIANKLIGALNCNPTEKIPTAWEKATARITGSIKLLFKPALWTAKKVIGAFKPTAQFLWSMGRGFVAEFVPSMNIVGQSLGKGKRAFSEFVDKIKNGLIATGDARKQVGGLIGAIVRLIDAVTPLKTAFLNLFNSSAVLSQNFGEASTSGERFGKMLGKIVTAVVKFGTTVAPGLGKVVNIIARITIEVGIFAAKVVWASRYIISAGVAIGVATVEATIAVAKFVASVWQGFRRVTEAAKEFVNTLADGVLKVITSFWDMAVAIDKVIMAIIKDKFPGLYNALDGIKKASSTMLGSFRVLGGEIGRALNPLNTQESVGFWQSLTTAISTTLFVVKKIAKFMRIIVFPKEIITGIIIGLDKMRQSLINTAATIKQEIKAIFDELDAKFNLYSKIDTLKMALVDLPRYVKAVYTKEFDKIKAIVVSVIQAIANEFEEIKFRFFWILSSIRAEFYSILERFVPAIVPVVQRVEQEIRKLFKPLVDLARYSLGAIVDIVKDYLQYICDIIKLTVNIAGAIVKGFFKSVAYLLIDILILKGRASIVDMINEFGALFKWIGDVLRALVSLSLPLFEGLKNGVLLVIEKIADGWSGFKQIIMNAFDPIPEAKAAVGELFVAIEKLGTGIVEITSSFFTFGVKVIGTIVDITSKFGGLVKSLIRVKLKMFMPVGPMGILAAIIDTSKAVLELINNLKNILIEAIPIFKKLEEVMSTPFKVATEGAKKIGQAITNPIKGITSKWGRGARAVNDSIETIGDTARVTGEEVESKIAHNSPGPAKMVPKKWAVAADLVRKSMQSMADKARATGKAIALANQSAIEETTRAYSKLDRTQASTSAAVRVPSSAANVVTPIHKKTKGFTAQYQKLGGDITQSNVIRKLTKLDERHAYILAQDNLTKKMKQTQIKKLATQREKLLIQGREELAQLKRLKETKEANARAGRAMQSATMSVGSALSNFAPQLATPLFVAGDMIDAYSDLSEAIPEVGKALMLKGATATATAATETAANGATAASSTGAAVVQQGAAASTAATEVTATGVITGAKLMLIGAYKATAAAAVWSAGVVKTALMSINPIAWVIAAAVTVIYLAFKHNFLNINDIVGGLIQTIAAIASPFITVGKAIFNFYRIIIVGVLSEIGKVFKIIGATIGSALYSIVIGIRNLFLPMVQLFDLFFGGGGSGGGSIEGLLAGIANTVVWAVGLITKAVAVVGGIISWVFSLLRPIGMWVGETVMSLGGLIAIFAVITNFGGAISLAFGGLAALFAPIVAFVTAVLPFLGSLWTIVQLIATVALPAMGVAFIPILIAIAKIAAVIAVIAAIGVVLKPLFNLVIAMIVGVVKGIKLVFGEVFGAIATEFGEVWSLIKELGSRIIEPFKPLFELFGGDGGEGGIMLWAMQRMVRNVLLPFKVLAVVLVGVVKLIAFFVKAIVWLGAGIVSMILSPFLLISMTIVKIVNLIRGAIEVVKGFGAMLAGAILAPFNAIVSRLGWIFGKIKGLFGGITEGEDSTPTSVQKFAAGGPVRGAGTGTSDDIPAMLSNGEFVVNAASTAKNLGLLNFLNATGYLPTIDLDYAREYGLLKAMEMASAPPSLEVAPAPKLDLPSQSEISAVNSSSQTNAIASTPINIEFSGDIIIKSESTPEMVKEMLAQLSPQLALQIKTILRDEVERRR